MPDDSFDVVVCFETIQHVNELDHLASTYSLDFADVNGDGSADVLGRDSSITSRSASRSGLWLTGRLPCGESVPPSRGWGK